MCVLRALQHRHTRSDHQMLMRWLSVTLTRDRAHGLGVWLQVCRHDVTSLGIVSRTDPAIRQADKCKFIIFGALYTALADSWFLSSTPRAACVLDLLITSPNRLASFTELPMASQVHFVLLNCLLAICEGAESIRRVACRGQMTHRSCYLLLSSVPSRTVTRVIFQP